MLKTFYVVYFLKIPSAFKETEVLSGLAVKLITSLEIIKAIYSTCCPTVCSA